MTKDNATIYLKHEKPNHKNEASLQSIQVHVSLYGSLASVWGKRYVAFGFVQLQPGATKGDLFAQLNIPAEQRGYVFINAVLCEVPGLNVGDEQVLGEGDHIGVFSVDRIWPYQYRDGIVMSAALKAVMQEFGAMHHSYKNVASQSGAANLSDGQAGIKD